MKKQNILLLIILFSILKCTAVNSSQIIKTNKTTISFTGDVMMHIAVKRCAKIKSKKLINNSGFDYLFEKIKPKLQKPDIMCGNLEFPVAAPYIQNGIVFNCPPQVVPALKDAGFDIFTMANNHVLDQGYSGVVKTMSHLEKAGLFFIGVNKTEKLARAGIIYKRNGIKIGLIAYTDLMNCYWPRKRLPKNFYLNHLYAKQKVKQDIKNIRAKCDILIMQAHAGLEYKIKPEKHEQKIFKNFLEQGVDLIIAHHPHVLQSYEQYVTKDGRTCSIFYSLGNFIADQTRRISLNKKGDYSSIRDSIIVNLDLYKEENQIIQKFRLTPIYTNNIIKKIGKQKYKDIQTIAIRDEILKLKENLDSSSAKESIRINKKIKFYQSRISAIKKVLFNNKKIPDNIVLE